LRAPTQRAGQPRVDFGHAASPRARRATHRLLTRLGPDFGVIDLDIPNARARRSRAEYVRRVAREGRRRLLQVVAVPGAVVLGADTEVILDDTVFGKWPMPRMPR
jgi:septum formation protein